MLYWNEIFNDLAKILTWFCSACFLSYKCSMCEPFVTQKISIRQSNSVQTDLSTSSSTLATAVVMHCFSSFKLTGSGGTKTLSLIYPTRRNHKELSLGLLRNVESVYFFYSNPVHIRLQSNAMTFIIPLTGNQFRSFRPTSGHRYTKLKTMVICSVHWFQVIWDPIYINDNIYKQPKVLVPWWKVK